MRGSSIELTEEGLTLEKVSDKRNVIFGTKSKSEIWALASGKAVNHFNAAPANPKGLGKRKAVDGTAKPPGSQRSPRVNAQDEGKRQGKGRAKAKVRREVSLDECLAKAVAVDACNAEHDASPTTADGYTSPPPSNFEVPVTPGKGTLPLSDEDEPMDTVVNVVNADAAGKAQVEVSNRTSTWT
ncbi:uncharacterized protein IUM83_15754 [Phytophthora cinnamomi]|uniref:uncharacterized protein n=1 Tax=Phytophthora cinnamomi TaxID=4785 RepID=UPI0035597C3D|nr:hypothetical protein IUM83_15754 [Phytophthora cinnamomi]